MGTASANKTVIRYLNRSALKIAVAAWQREQFEQAEDRTTGHHFLKSQFLDAFAHCDGVIMQLAAAFDAFACAVAHQFGMSNPDKADFAAMSGRLAKVAGGKLGDRIRAVAGEDDFRGLQLYRNVAAHRTVMPERISLSEHEETGVDVVSFRLADSLPPGAPDEPRTPVRAILARYLDWTNQRLPELHGLAIEAWSLTDDNQLRADLGLRPSRGPHVVGGEPRITTREHEPPPDLADK